jgi:outer membrane protein TolC
MAKPRKKDNGAPQNAGDTTAATIDRDELAQRAYELYLARGGEDGRDIDDWLNAERELRDRREPETQGQ